jgi:hypothetical protein
MGKEIELYEEAYSASVEALPQELAVSGSFTG